eukprot:m.163926 g.163926  ORF g.163926 m.163926 type:complete len:1125 (-) comp17702_c0_seq2:235-3609(-)
MARGRPSRRKTPSAKMREIQDADDTRTKRARVSRKPSTDATTATTAATTPALAMAATPVAPPPSAATAAGAIAAAADIGTVMGQEGGTVLAPYHSALASVTDAVGRFMASVQALSEVASDPDADPSVRTETACVLSAAAAVAASATAGPTNERKPASGAASTASVAATASTKSSNTKTRASKTKPNKANPKSRDQPHPPQTSSSASTNAVAASTKKRKVPEPAASSVSSAPADPGSKRQREDLGGMFATIAAGLAAANASATALAVPATAVPAVPAVPSSATASAAPLMSGALPPPAAASATAMSPAPVPARTGDAVPSVLGALASVVTPMVAPAVPAATAAATAGAVSKRARADTKPTPPQLPSAVTATLYDSDEDQRDPAFLSPMPSAPGFHQDPAVDAASSAHDTVDVDALMQGIELAEKFATETAESDAYDKEMQQLLSVKLMDHQKLGVAWMRAQELGSKPRGGLLADEQGLGKTVQSVALMLSNVPEPDPDDPRTPLRNLVVVPASLMHQWAEEIQRLAKRCLRIEVHHGPEKSSDCHWLAQQDVVITTYHTLSGEQPLEGGVRPDGTKKKKRSRGPLFKVRWFRIILDEATAVKNRQAAASLAVSKLKGERRWCLSGTPLQNTIEDLFPLMRFLKVQPYGEDFKRFKLLTIHQIQPLMKSFTLRRTKAQLLNALPDKQVDVVYVEFSEEERDYYAALEQGAQLTFAEYVRKGTVNAHYASALQMLLKLRQACNHPLLNRESRRGYEAHLLASRARHDDEFLPEAPMPAQTAGGSTKGAAAAAKLKPAVVERLLSGLIDSECSICLDATVREESVLTQCGHFYCQACITSHFNLRGKAQGDDTQVDCPDCRAPILKSELVPTVEVLPPEQKEAPAEKDNVNKAAAAQTRQRQQELQTKATEACSMFNQRHPNSAKINRALDILKEVISHDSDKKILIFSQWTTMLDMMEKPLQKECIEYARYDGSLTVKERDQVVHTFREDQVNVLLCSLKCAAYGLNLKEASTVIIIDPWWNPSVEWQAIDRVHRIGQLNDVHVSRLIVRGTVEERILEMQRRKQDLGQTALGERVGLDAGRLSAEDLCTLFGVEQRRQSQGVVGAATTAAASAAAPASAPSSRRKR